MPLFSPQRTRGGVPEAALRLTIATAILMGIAVYGYAQAHREAGGGRPGLIATVGQKIAACDRATMSTVAGPIGCASARKKVGNIAFASAGKH